MEVSIQTFTPRRRLDSARIAGLYRFCMRRYSNAWTARNIKAAERWFSAAERYARLKRLAA